MAAGLPLDYFVESVFNYPTLAECYKVAALDGINRTKPARVVEPESVADPAAPPSESSPSPAMKHKAA